MFISCQLLTTANILAETGIFIIFSSLFERVKWSVMCIFLYILFKGMVD